MAEQLSLESVGPRVGLRVVSVWYLQTGADIRHGRASIRLGTNMGEFFHDTSFDEAGLRQARSVARGCGVELVIAHDLRDVVVLWEGDHG